MRILSTIIAVVTGIIVLAGYFFPYPGIMSIRKPLLDWAVTLAGVAGLVAVLNLVFGVHWRRVKEGGKFVAFSAVVILAFFITVVVGIYFGPASTGFTKIVTAIQVPIESSLMAVLAVTLAYSSVRLLQRQRNLMGFIFFVSVLIFLVLNSGILAYTTEIPILRDILSAFHQVPVAGARGILLGVALGSLVTGIRVLLGQDRSYNG